MNDKAKPHVRIDSELHRQLKVKAANEGTTIGKLIEQAIEIAFGIKLDKKEMNIEKDAN